MKTTEAYELTYGAAEQNLFTGPGLGHRTILAKDGHHYTLVDLYEGHRYCAECLPTIVDTELTDHPAATESTEAAMVDGSFHQAWTDIAEVYLFGSDDGPYTFMTVMPMPDDHYDGPVLCEGSECTTWLAGSIPASYLQDCLQAYLSCLIWTGLNWADATGPNRDPRQLDETHDVDDIPADVVTELSDELQDFLRSNWADVEAMDPEQVGHDFCLSRNGHGTGFWDRGNGDLGDRLHKAAKVYGSCDLDVGDDRVLYLTN